MKKQHLLFTAAFLLLGIVATAQDVSELQKNAKAFMLQGDYANAVLVLNRVLQIEPENIEASKDLAMDYYLQKDNDKALATIKPLLERDDADDQCYQIAGDIYQALQLNRDCEKVYRTGLRKFPKSGPLYNDFGELLWNEQDEESIKEWEKGIEADPDYPSNYYNACKYYNAYGDKVWCIIYGEIFINAQPLGSRTPEIKNVLLSNYKKLFADADLTKSNSSKNKFAQAFIETMNKESGIAINGINPETLTMIRTRFILDWDQDYAAKFPFRLFELQKQLLQTGMFDAYDEWVFGTTQNLAAYQNWITTHSSEYADFSRFQKNRVLKIPPGEYYK